MKLSKRLTHIKQMITSEYTHIWDCCCDHGFLGASLLTNQAAKNIHFVDIVPELITKVEGKLQQFYPNSPSNWLTHCINVEELPLHKYKGKHLIIIAGVGGDLITQFITSIHQQHPNVVIDFILCPVHHQYTLREKLIELKFSLKDEALIEDNKRFYEIIYVASNSDNATGIHSTGDKIWQSTTTKQANVVKQYLAKTLDHYGRIKQGNTNNVDHIIAAYNLIKLKL